MNISEIQSPASPVLQSFKLLDSPKAAEAAENASFESFFQAYMDVYNEADNSVKVMETKQVEVATGVSDDILGLTLAMQEANTSVNFTVQITNRILESYKEIMRIQM